MGLVSEGQRRFQRARAEGCVGFRVAVHRTASSMAGAVCEGLGALGNQTRVPGREAFRVVCAMHRSPERT